MLGVPLLSNVWNEPHKDNGAALQHKIGYEYQNKSNEIHTPEPINQGMKPQQEVILRQVWIFLGS